MARTVMIVDDIPFVRKTLREIFSAAHFKVVGEAADGMQAVAMYMELRPDLVTMDVIMPVISGIEATRRILKSDKTARIIMISAMGQEHLVMEAINVGARDYLLKPFSKDDVLKAAEKVLMDLGHVNDQRPIREI